MAHSGGDAWMKLIGIKDKKKKTKDKKSEDKENLGWDEFPSLSH